jgi:hypothetical protein
MKKVKVVEIPFYCRECGKCGINAKEVENNLRIKNNTGYTHDIHCLKLGHTVYMM